MESRSAHVAAVAALLLAAAAAGGNPRVCVDQYGYIVDWYVVYKLPRLENTASDLVNAGVGYLYFSSLNQGDRQWVLSDVGINDTRSAPARTLAPIYADPRNKSQTYLFYNDEHPDGPTSFDLGHTKGVVSFEAEAGFWLVHSVPKYPPPPGAAYGYPASGERYGQSFICISMRTDSAPTVASQLMLTQPFIYAGQVAAELAARYPTLVKVLQGGTRTAPPWFGVRAIDAPLGQSGVVVSYAKAAEFGQDLYADLVSGFTRRNFYAETWQNGPRADRIATTCNSDFPVYNVRDISVAVRLPPPAGGWFNASFSSAHDHSKWAVTTTLGDDSTDCWVCIGDINRMTTQERRGGGTICTGDASLWLLFYNMIAAVEACDMIGIGGV